MYICIPYAEYDAQCDLQEASDKMGLKYKPSLWKEFVFPILENSVKFLVENHFKQMPNARETLLQYLKEQK